MVTSRPRAGLQLAKFGDVRRHGALVGHVREISNDGKQAVIKVALEPSAAENIPRTSARDPADDAVRPEVHLDHGPDAPVAGALERRDVIPADRVARTSSCRQILADLFPLLRSIRPADLSSTLYALATALGGRGDQLGETMVKLGQLPDAITSTCPRFARTSCSWPRSPGLRSPRPTWSACSQRHHHQQDGREKRRQLETFFVDVTGLGETSTRILARQRGRTSSASAGSPSRCCACSDYSPEFPCLLKGAALRPIVSKTSRATGLADHDSSTTQRRLSTAGPACYGEQGHGPWCDGLPNLEAARAPSAVRPGHRPRRESAAQPRAQLRRCRRYAQPHQRVRRHPGERQVVNPMLASHDRPRRQTTARSARFSTARWSAKARRG